MSDFLIAYKETMKIEGGYANNPNDRGGETWRGIARNYHRTWGGWTLIDLHKKEKNWIGNLKDDKMLQELVLNFYATEFWDKLNLGRVNNQAIANELFDTAVNMGPGVAGLFLQRVLNVSNNRAQDYPNLTLDGDIGAKTIAVLNAHRRPAMILKLLNCLQGAKYIAICEANESQETFLTGWASRVLGV